MNHKAPSLTGLFIAAIICVFCLSASAQDAATSPVPATRDIPTFIGSDACKMCHSKIYEEWMATPHSKLLTVEGLAADKKGCEACHGRGSRHVATTGKTKFALSPKTDPKAFAAVCAPCHVGSPNTVVPKEWQKLDAKYWGRSEHSRVGVSCPACHTMHSSAPKLLNKPQEDLCLTCHSKVIGKSDKNSYTHAPVAQKQCALCHDPHGASPRHLVRPNIQTICESCHKPDADLNSKHAGINIAATDCTDCHQAHSHDQAGSLIKKFKHGPLKAGSCNSCHKTTDPSNPVALVKPEKELCVSCHSKDLHTAPGAHKPVADGMCTTCHSPHFSSEPKLLKDKPAHMCFNCHSKIEDSMRAKFKHKPMEDQNCLACHKPHGSGEDSLLKKASIDLCKDCHKPHLHSFGKRKDGTEVIDPTTKKMLVCASCHEPHGSEWQHLTKGNYERDLCLRCHKKGMEH